MTKSWDVDPETRTKLIAIQRSKGNDRCCDCGVPSPQWASPKFGTFICLNCAGIHRGLGVHISFVRSITMDAFKVHEVQRMEYGGNESWKDFFNSHSQSVAEGRTFEESTVKERYEGEVGDEWKARLSAKVEGREYVPGEERNKVDTPRSSTPQSQSQTQTQSQSYNNLPSNSRSESPARRPGGNGMNSTQKEKNEAYFAKLGQENDSRPDDLAPSQGGKYGGFGGGMPVSTSNTANAQRQQQQQNGGGIPGVDDFQKDPMAALTKGFGWFTTTVGNSAKSVNDSYIQPTAQTVAQSEFASNARVTAAEMGRNLQTGARSATEQLNRFVEGSSDGHGHGHGATASRAGRYEPEHKEFWDDFSTLGDSSRRSTMSGGASGHGRGASAAGGGSGSGAIGTATMKRGASTKSKTKTKDDDWDDNW